jgi:hypothetical protein
MMWVVEMVGVLQYEDIEEKRRRVCDEDMINCSHGK